ncbi:glycine/D-amino acid oxidase-like deaminating enzyme/nitrite reductase/ring-hydroxylating ferredoxin subunit [Bacillus ectoiniformans]|uniref:FAD-dependent oxidoreductase n=1 Tax=Bacillus ectoiniformans TaxID=1494429 RepID=UPI0019597F7B|nr:FAD-dependent oxidoreductase [Bacillus ectoiniformans]MBM7649212.1 glycine/D-amino acid oxidase-like deaminating enzyme/nitrite reductase/ring-hydroxylating ferredoxin subunit [Bacillus ectoiniformans]
MDHINRKPLWKDGQRIPSFPALNNDLFTETVIVGGGITGIVTAYLLTKAGRKVVLLEASELVNGTTGHTTAKLTAQHRLKYDQLMQTLNEEQAKLYYEANIEAIEWARSLAKNEQISCDWEDTDAYVFTNEETEAEKVRKEAEAYERLGIAGGEAESMPWDIPFKQAVVMENQAQFHPVAFLSYLVNFIKDHGGEIFEHTTAIDVEKGDKVTVITDQGLKVTGNSIVIASHFPFFDEEFYFARMHAERSYIIAIKPKREIPAGMYINAEQPTRSIRSAAFKGEKILLIGGENHPTGKGQPTEEHYQALIDYAEQEFGVEEVLFTWSAQDLITLDQIPYIGRIKDDENIFVATGYQKWGMSLSIAASLLLSDLMLNKQNRYEELFSPDRFKAQPGVANFVKQTSNVAALFVKGKLDYFFKNNEELPINQGVVINWEGKRAGAFKEENGSVHLVDTTCTHMGCECEWNGAERTWDCPCHGSRFSVSGEVVEGPAKKPLKRLGENHTN